jgi:hypothetical protein
MIHIPSCRVLNQPQQSDAAPIPLSWISLAVVGSFILLVLLFETTGLSIALNGGAVAFALTGIALLGIRMVTGRRGTNFHPA